MKVALLGAMHWHASCYWGPSKKRGHEVILFDEDREGVREKAESRGYGWRSDYAALDEVRPDFAFCLGRHDQTSDLVAMCVERKIPFLVEKPGGRDAPTVQALARRCDELKLFNASPFCARWDNAVRRVKSMLDSGELGRVACIHASYIGGHINRYANWGCPWVAEKSKALGGSIYNEAVHALDLLRYWGFNLKYHSGRASYGISRSEVDDVITMLLDCGPDTYAVVESGYLVQNPWGGLTFSLYCEKANIDYRNLEMTIVRSKGEREVVKSLDPDFRDEMIGELFSLSAAGKPAPSTLHDVAATLEICDAYRQDAESK